MLLEGKGLNFRSSRLLSALGTTLTAAVLAASPAWAGPTALGVELNKLEPQANGCRAFVVVQNDSTTLFQSVKLDLVLFQTDGVIGRRFAIDLAPIKPQKRTVKLFDLEGMACDKIGSLLINDVVECKADAGPLDDCLAGMTVKSLTNVQLTK